MAENGHKLEKPENKCWGQVPDLVVFTTTISAQRSKIYSTVHLAGKERLIYI